MGISPTSLLARDTQPPIPHSAFMEERLCDSLMESVSFLMENLQSRWDLISLLKGQSSLLQKGQKVILWCFGGVGGTEFPPHNH